MSVLIEDVTEAAMSLPVDERAILADRLVKSLDNYGNQAELREEQLREVRRRVAEVRSGKVELIDSDVAFARIEKILAK